MNGSAQNVQNCTAAFLCVHIGIPFHRLILAAVYHAAVFLQAPWTETGSADGAETGLCRLPVPLYLKYGVQDLPAAVRFHDAGKKGLQIFPPVVVFGCIYNVVRFQQDLIVQSVNAGVGMVMAH